mmetsp:Transcript_11010/g.33763  ORF Transcript_11010/g.33763 Transcript_11010/m.33763 type:complete len:428 (+) Transcript_11010:205-1488(+)|eukprot:CAMPEP_0198725150 /NCGR_PEP_ID=MMETSP1475-20131203/2477_1 /TAXON_ID= ORGANISM="Unidentified sp., Strain CCMP1999" /NCGR_SAMPLE_ID=MMETSP1475 /ASSEMBLY_ACC=CAM_ASM_001111 /LENGTH=427 /DNA_ID=CAMNT_0044486863 /DNA_START=162 /DNA_END=1445 /DNA_ORIENTATION=-
MFGFVSVSVNAPGNAKRAEVSNRRSIVVAMAGRSRRRYDFEQTVNGTAVVDAPRASVDVDTEADLIIEGFKIPKGMTPQVDGHEAPLVSHLHLSWMSDRANKVGQTESVFAKTNAVEVGHSQGTHVAPWRVTTTRYGPPKPSSTGVAYDRKKAMGLANRDYSKIVQAAPRVVENTIRSMPIKEDTETRKSAEAERVQPPKKDEAQIFAPKVPAPVTASSNVREERRATPPRTETDKPTTSSVPKEPVKEAVAPKRAPAAKPATRKVIVVRGGNTASPAVPTAKKAQQEKIAVVAASAASAPAAPVASTSLAAPTVSAPMMSAPAPVASTPAPMSSTPAPVASTPLAASKTSAPAAERTARTTYMKPEISEPKSHAVTVSSEPRRTLLGDEGKKFAVSLDQVAAKNLKRMTMSFAMRVQAIFAGKQSA